MPYYHSNIDSDEVMFYVEASLGVEALDVLAVMVDTFRTLEIGEAGRACDDGVRTSS